MISDSVRELSAQIAMLLVRTRELLEAQKSFDEIYNELQKKIESATRVDGVEYSWTLGEGVGIDFVMREGDGRYERFSCLRVDGWILRRWTSGEHASAEARRIAEMVSQLEAKLEELRQRTAQARVLLGALGDVR